jgi:hypothetical protein
MIMFYRYKPPQQGGPSDDPTPDYMNLLGMIFSMCGLMMKVCFYMYMFCKINFFLMSDKQYLIIFMMSRTSF